MFSREYEQPGSWVKRRFRLTRSNDFKRVRRDGISRAHPLVVLALAQNEEQRVRIAVVAGHRVGGAVVRNRVKRRMRAVLHQLLPALKPGWDLIFIARPPAAKAEFHEIQASITGLVKRAGIYRVEVNGTISTPGLSE